MLASGKVMILQSQFFLRLSLALNLFSVTCDESTPGSLLRALRIFVPWGLAGDLPDGI